jgi:phosphatidylserine/phosphatidylglycerophosphate/cardiolipin synthase-like enzyme
MAAAIMILVSYLLRAKASSKETMNEFLSAVQGNRFADIRIVFPSTLVAFFLAHLIVTIYSHRHRRISYSNTFIQSLIRSGVTASMLLMAIGNGLCDAQVVPAKTPAGAENGVAVYFSPEADCLNLVIDQIRGASDEILVQAYSFSSEKIARALVDAHKRGVKVVVIIDADKADKKSETHFLAKRNIDTYADSSHEKAHSKIILIDGRLIISGSFNFTDEDAKDRADNLLIIRDKPRLMAAYKANFQQHLSHSKKPKDK